MVETSILSEMDVAVCNAIRERNDSHKFLTYLERHSLFLIPLGPDRFRYHHLFRDFLIRRGELTLEQSQTLHTKAAAYYLDQKQREDSIFHLLEASEFEHAAQIIAKIASDMLQAGRYGRLARWIDLIPPDLYATYPTLLLGRGDVHRFHSRFEEAFACYEQAHFYYESQQDKQGQVLALQGQALIYIDTVYPNQAAPLLKRALGLLNRTAPQQRARLLLLVAENKVNRGQLCQGERLHRRLYHLCNFDDIPEIDPRLSIRTGRLAQTQQTVSHMLDQDPLAQGGRRTPRAHREAILILSWVNAYQGNGDLARRQAEQGI